MLRRILQLTVVAGCLGAVSTLSAAADSAPDSPPDSPPAPNDSPPESPAERLADTSTLAPGTVATPTQLAGVSTLRSRNRSSLGRSCLRIANS